MAISMLNLDEKYARDMVDHALAEDPNECCGILAGKNGGIDKIYRMVNTESSPYRYNLDPQEQIQVDRDISDTGRKMMAIYHSHTHSEAYPSATDIRLANPWYTDIVYILVSLLNRENPQIRAFRIESDAAIEEELHIIKTP
tara:strand:+ start:87 stop:512 length:426 start_codon:yes stop_codon:yes gene_type:complete